MQAPIWHFSSCHIGQTPSQPSSQTVTTRIEAEPPKGNMTADEIAPDHLTNPFLCRPMALSTEGRLSPSGTPHRSS